MQKIIRFPKQVDNNDWRRLEAYALGIVALSSGLRNVEIRFCDVADLDTRIGSFGLSVSRDKDHMGNQTC